MVLPAKHISVSINSAPSQVYRFTSNPENLPKWAEGLSSASVTGLGDEWICDSPMGRVKVKFAEQNNFGVMDHDVTLPTGEKNHNPFRVLANQEGSEVVFTLYRLPRMTEDEFNKGAEQITKDLKTLKTLLEKKN